MVPDQDNPDWDAIAINHYSAEVHMTVLGLRSCTLFYNDRTDPDRPDNFVKSVLIPLCMELGIEKDGFMLRKVVEDFWSETGEDLAGSWVLVNTNHDEWDLVNAFFFTPGQSTRRYTDTTKVLDYPITDFDDCHCTWTTHFIYKDLTATRKVRSMAPMTPETEENFFVVAYDYCAPPGHEQETHSRAVFAKTRDTLALYGREIELLVKLGAFSELSNHHESYHVRGGNYRLY
jgi:hypothetical protein